MMPFVIHHGDSAAAASLYNIAQRLSGMALKADTAKPEETQGEARQAVEPKTGAETGADPGDQQRGLHRFIGELHKLFSASG